MEWTEKVAMYALLANYSDYITGYEVFDVWIRKPDKFLNRGRENTPSNEKFGLEHRSKFFGGVIKNLAKP